MPNDKKHLEQKVIMGTIELIETIENSKVESVTLDDGQTFYRAESHVLKIIGEEPGIYSSEIARRFRVTRGAIQKVLGRLEKRGLLTKTVDAADKKRIQLYLTPSGSKALEKLVLYQTKVNAKFFSAIAAMAESELLAVTKFLSMAHDVLNSMK